MVVGSVSRDAGADEGTDTLLEIWTEMITSMAGVGVDRRSSISVEGEEAMRMAKKDPGMPSGDMARVVASVLAALETVATSHVDMAEALLVSIQSRESEQVVSVLEHGLAVLEKVSASSARKARKAIDDLCERLEQALESLDEGSAIDQLASCEPSELTTLAEQLKAMSQLDAGTGGGCTPTVEAVLETLARP